MVLRIVPFYAALLALLFMVLSVRVMRERGRARVAIGTGGNIALERRIRVHGNFAEYVPLALLLLAFMELRGSAGVVSPPALPRASDRAPRARRRRVAGPGRAAAARRGRGAHDGGDDPRGAHAHRRRAVEGSDGARPGRPTSRRAPAARAEGRGAVRRLLARALQHRCLDLRDRALGRRRAEGRGRHRGGAPGRARGGRAGHCRAAAARRNAARRSAAPSSSIAAST